MKKVSCAPRFTDFRSHPLTAIVSWYHPPRLQRVRKCETTIKSRHETFSPPSPNAGFHQWGYPSHHRFSIGIFQYKPTIFRGTPMTMESLEIDLNRLPSFLLLGRAFATAVFQHSVEVGRFRVRWILVLPSNTNWWLNFGIEPLKNGGISEISWDSMGIFRTRWCQKCVLLYRPFTSSMYHINDKTLATYCSSC